MKKKKKKGFTLIELLAIIVILAIIAVITVPIILNIIESARKGSAHDSAYGIRDTAKNYFFKLDRPELTESYACTFPDNCDDLEYEGTTPTSGNVRVSDKGVVNGEVTFFDQYTYCIYKGDVLEGTCEETVANSLKEDITKAGTHIYNPDGTLDIDKIYNCIEFDVEVASGTTIPFCVIGETTDSVTLVTKDNIGYSQWSVNDIYGKLLTETKGWTNVPAVNGYSYEDSERSAYKTITINSGKLTVVYRDDTEGTIGSDSDTSNQLRARALTAQEAYQVINGTTNISDNTTCNYPPSFLDSTWTMTYGSTSSTSSSPGVIKKAYEVRTISINRECGILENAVSDTADIKAVITLAKSSL